MLTIIDALMQTNIKYPVLCFHCESTEVVFDLRAQDGYCKDCGKWQLESNNQN